MKIKNGNKGVREKVAGGGENATRGVAGAGQALPLRRTADAASSTPTNGGNQSFVRVNKQRPYESAGSSPYLRQDKQAAPRLCLNKATCPNNR